MKKIILAAIMLLSGTLANITTNAQVTEKKEEEKSKTTTVDVWRGAMPPQSEQNSDIPPVVVMEESTDNVESKENVAEVEKRVIALDQRLMEALKKRDAVALNSLVADDFMLVGVTIPGEQTDKIRYIDWALKKVEIKSYNLEKTTVRAYPTLAIVTTKYKRQATIAGAPSDGDFIVTNVWVKRGKMWQAVSQHTSQASKP